MVQIAAGVAAPGVMMGPMQHAPLGAPFIFTREIDLIADTQRFDTRCQVNVVRNQQRVSGFQLDDEFLMAAALRVIRQDLDDLAGTIDLKVALLSIERLGDRVVT